MSRHEEIQGFSEEVLRKTRNGSVWLQLTEHGGRGRVAYAAGVCIDPAGILLTVDHLFRNISGKFSLAAYINDKRIVTPLSIEMYDGIDLAVIKLQGIKNLPTVQLLERDLKTEGERIVVVAHKLEGKKDFRQVLIEGVGGPTNIQGFHDDNYPNMTSEDLWGFAFGDAAVNQKLIFEGMSGSGMFTQDGRLAGLVKGQEHILSYEGNRNIIGVALRSTRIYQILSQ